MSTASTDQASAKQTLTEQTVTDQVATYPATRDQTKIVAPVRRAPSGRASGDSPPADTRKSGTGDRLYRIVWRWHFYAGMIVGPALIVVAATGALYIFKDELEAVLHPGVTRVEPSAERATYDEQIAAAHAAAPGNKIGMMQVFADPRRATALAMGGTKFQYAFTDPYRGHYLGSIENGAFFDDVLNLHRTLFLGTTGRIVVELCTCWTIVLAATGIYLWWPRKANQVWGVWLPRLRRKPYVILRDLHSVVGAYLAVVAIVIALTGLIYTYVWGGGYQYFARRADAYDIFSKPMQSKSLPEAPDAPIDRVVQAAKERLPGNNLNIWFPRAPNAVYIAGAGNERGPQLNTILFIDRGSGEILEERPLSQTNTFYWFGNWNYALHAGTVWGMPTKIVWFVACAVLVTSPLTGLWMWWERRPKGRLGLPRRIDARRPRWLIATIALCSLLLPAMGLSVVVVLVIDWFAVRLRRAWA